ncbi:UNVERIFIED_CONTAM: hypothetical protein K2H54_057588 [Gekko kuhli]
MVGGALNLVLPVSKEAELTWFSMLGGVVKSSGSRDLLICLIPGHPQPIREVEEAHRAAKWGGGQTLPAASWLFLASSIWRQPNGSSSGPSAPSLILLMSNSSSHGNQCSRPSGKPHPQLPAGL